MSTGPTPVEKVHALLDLDRHTEAREATAALLAASPDDAHLHALMADALTGLGDHEAALVAANRTVALAPLSADGHRRCALACHRLGRQEAALAAARETVRLSPHHWEHHALLAQVASHRGATLLLAWDAALHAVQLGPEAAGAHFTVGLVADRRHDLATAVRAYRAALALDPTHATALHNLSLAEGEHDLGRVTRGISGALALDPQRAEFRDTLDHLVWRTVLGIWGSGLLVVWAMPTLLLPLTMSLAPPAFAAAVTAVVALTVVVGWVLWVLRVPRSIRRYAATHVRRRRGLQLMLLTAGFSLVAAVVESARELGDTALIASLAVLLQLVALVWGLVERRRRARAGS